MKATVWLMGAAIALAGCGADAPADAGSDAGGAVAAAKAPAVDAPTAEPTGAVIEVRMITDERGNYFEPSVIEARRGDVVRFVLESGVHNASFPASQNANGEGLPEPGPLLQLPGQTYDVTVDFAPGEYFFQCDPHAALGMTGTLTVQD